MVELRCPNCKRVWQYDGLSKFYTHCPQCSATVWIASPRNYGKNNPRVRSSAHGSSARQNRKSVTDA